MVENPPANAGDMGSVPGLGRFHMLHVNQARTLEPLKPVTLEPVPQQEKPPQGQAHTPQLE